MKALVVNLSSGKKQQIPNAQILEVEAGIVSSDGQNLSLDADTKIIILLDDNTLNIGQTTGLSINQSGIQRQNSGELNLATTSTTTNLNIGHSGINIFVLGNVLPNSDLGVIFGSSSRRINEIHSNQFFLRDDITDTTVSTLEASGISVEQTNFTININGSPALVFNTSSQILIQSGNTFTTTGSGNINLPNNGSARFQIEGANVGANVTSANLNTLTGGSIADSLHVHTLSALLATSGEAISSMAPVSFENVAGNSRVFQSDANASTNRHFVSGFATNSTSGSGQAMGIAISGELTIPDARWDSVPVASNIGDRVYLSATAGKITLTAPSSSGDYVQKLGIVTFAGTVNGTKILVQIGDSILLS